VIDPANLPGQCLHVDGGIVVRDSSSNPGCAGCVRITIGTPAQMESVIPAIRQSIAETRI